MLTTNGIASSDQSPNTFTPIVPFHCASPSDESNVTYVVGLSVGTLQDNIQFNTTSLHVPAGSCIKLILTDLSPDMTHGFSIDEVGGGSAVKVDANLNGPNIDAVDMIIANSTSDIGFGPGVNVFYIATPLVQSQFTYYCLEPGHEAAGERGTFYVDSTTTTTALGTTTTGNTIGNFSSNAPSNPNSPFGFNDVDLQKAFIIGEIIVGLMVVIPIILLLNKKDLHFIWNKKQGLDGDGATNGKMHLSDSTLAKMEELIDETKKED